MEQKRERPELIFLIRAFTEFTEYNLVFRELVLVPKYENFTFSAIQTPLLLGRQSTQRCTHACLYCFWISWD